MASHTGLANIKSDDDVAVTGDLTVTAATVLNGTVAVGNATTDTIGLYGVTKVAQAASASQAAVTKTAVTALASTVMSAAFTGMWAFSSSTVGHSWRTRINQCVVDIGALTTLVNKMRTDLIALGAIKGSA